MLGDYRVEVQLVQYTGTGRLSDGTCCDLELDTSCSPAETCDVQFVFRIRNIGDITVNLNPQTKGAGRYDNTNRLNFVNCAELPTTGQVVASNPLAFTIPSTNWTGTVSGSTEMLLLALATASTFAGHSQGDYRCSRLRSSCW